MATFNRDRLRKDPRVRNTRGVSVERRRYHRTSLPLDTTQGTTPSGVYRLAAKRAGVGERTLRRWLTEDEAFKADLMQARRATFEAGVERAQALTGLAVDDTLHELLAEKKHPAVRLRAARLLLEFSTNRNDQAPRTGTNPARGPGRSPQRRFAAVVAFARR